MASGGDVESDGVAIARYGLFLQRVKVLTKGRAYPFGMVDHGPGGGLPGER
jgi:hypothetical protein